MKTSIRSVKNLAAVILVLGAGVSALAKNGTAKIPSIAHSGDDFREVLKESPRVKGSKIVLPNLDPKASLGGVSDGGGNAVGSTLFDFYENEGSQELSVLDLVKLEPLALRTLQALDAAVPANYLIRSERQGFGTAILNAVAKKKIYLESKSIQSAGCVNQSMVAASGQVIVACQSDLEIRFSKVWFDQADAKNRAGLILHELILGWARAGNTEMDKAGLEALVRNLNRQIFTLPAAQWAKAINASFPEYHALSVSDLREEELKAAKRQQQASKALQVLERSRADYREEGLAEAFESLTSSVGSAEMSSDACEVVVSSFNSFAQIKSKPALSITEICGK